MSRSSKSQNPGTCLLRPIRTPLGMLGVSFYLWLFASCSAEKPPQPPDDGQPNVGDFDALGRHAPAHRRGGLENPLPTTPDDLAGSPSSGSGDRQGSSDGNQPPPGTENSPGSGTPPPAKDPTGNTGKQEDPVLLIHQNKPTQCAGCHENKRLSATHYPKSDCVLCHKYPSFKGGSFSHDPKPESCETCHTRPATTGLRAYPNQGPPPTFNANDPASVGGGHYKGKDCVQCHQTQKEGAIRFQFAHSKPSPGACLPCHYNQGFRRHRNDQNISFAAFGNCNSCHLHFDVNVQRDFEPGN